MSAGRHPRGRARRYGERDNVAAQALTGIGIVAVTSCALALLGLVLAVVVSLAF